MYIRQRSVISAGALASSFSKAAMRLFVLALLQQLHGSLVLLEGGSGGRGRVTAGLGGLRRCFLAAGCRGSGVLHHGFAGGATVLNAQFSRSENGWEPAPGNRSA